MDADTQIFDKLQQLDCLSGVSILDDMGEVIISSVKEAELNEFISFLSGVSAILASNEHLGIARIITLKSPNDENLIVHMMGDKVIAATSPCQLSCTIASHKIEQVLKEYRLH